MHFPKQQHLSRHSKPTQSNPTQPARRLPPHGHAEINARLYNQHVRRARRSAVGIFARVFAVGVSRAHYSHNTCKGPPFCSGLFTLLIVVGPVNIPPSRHAVWPLARRSARSALPLGAARPARQRHPEPPRAQEMTGPAPPQRQSPVRADIKLPGSSMEQRPALNGNDRWNRWN